MSEQDIPFIKSLQPSEEESRWNENMMSQFLSQSPAYLWFEDFTDLIAAVTEEIEMHTTDTQGLENRVSFAISMLMDQPELSPQVKYGNPKSLELSNATAKTAIENFSLIARGYQGLLREVVAEIIQNHTSFSRLVYWMVDGEKRYIRLQFQVLHQVEPRLSTLVFATGFVSEEPSSSSASQIMEQYQLLYKVSQLMLTTTSLRRFLESTVSLIHHHYESFGTLVALVNLERRSIQRAFLNDHELSKDELAVEVPPAHFWDGLSGWAIRTHETIYSPQSIPDFRENHESMKNRETNECGAVIVVPIQSQQLVLGTLTIVGNPKQTAFKKHDIQIAETMANHIAIGLQHFGLLERTQRMVHTDLLTNLQNREHFMQMAELEYGRAVSAEERIGVIMMDIDNFKQINDQHGNLVGDDVLKAVADRLSRIVREKSALISRFDGDEFCVMLKIRSTRALYKLANELRIAIGSDPVTSAPIVVKLTLSAGICHSEELPAYPNNLREFLNLASQSLLEAKAHGRNQVWPAVSL